MPSASFQTQGRLLQELGERLVARADVALTELIKNAYDADATECEVEFGDGQLIVRDDGHGMTEEEFLSKWMQIATPDKQRNRLSRKFERNVTGSKGIGRFAVRFLGKRLELETIAASGGEILKLKVTFDWAAIDKRPELQKVKIPYTLSSTRPNERVGTTLKISGLRSPNEETITKDLRTSLLSIAHPYAGLEKGRFDRRIQSDADPGFNILLPGPDEDDESDLTSAILDNAFAKLTIDCRKSYVEFSILDNRDRKLLKRRIERRSQLENGFFADIRYFPRRKGMFVGRGVDGRKAWKWIGNNENNGIGIVDHGFRIRPYGFGEDDWLQLSYDAAHRSRDWRSPFTMVKMPQDAKSNAKANPMLYLPGFHQLIGAVFVESDPAQTSHAKDLTPSMDREGFVDNEGFRELRDLVRAGLELLAYVDHREQRKNEERRREEEASEFRKDLDAAVDFIESVPGLAVRDRRQVVARFEQLSADLEEKEEYYRIGTQKLEMMGLLGVMAGFITHEMDRVLHDLKDLLRKTKQLEKKDKTLAKIRARIESSLATVSGQLDYATAFVGSVHASAEDPGEYSARGTAMMIKNRLQSFYEERGVDVSVDIRREVRVPNVPKALYHGVAMNLFTNALKAAVGGESASKDPRVVIKSWNEKGKHIFEVADNGIGIPPSIEKRIWDPLFTTTSSGEFNPLGSGMGLGLTLVKKLVGDVGGSIRLVTPPPEFSTCFRVEFPISD
ncbi:MAG: sensor histidine kinase [Planctomycetota bacterium]